MLGRRRLTYVGYAGLWVTVFPLHWFQLFITALTGQHPIREATHLPHTETSLACL